PLHGLGKFVAIRRIHVNHGVARQLRDSSARACDTGETTGHGFEEPDAEGLVPHARKAEDATSSERVWRAVVLEETGELDRVPALRSRPQEPPLERLRAEDRRVVRRRSDHAKRAVDMSRKPLVRVDEKIRALGSIHEARPEHYAAALLSRRAR